MNSVKRKSPGTHFSMCVQPAFIIGTNNEDGTHQNSNREINFPVYLYSRKGGLHEYCKPLRKSSK